MRKIRILVANEPAPLGGVEAWRIFWPLDLLERTYPDTIEVVYSRGRILPSDFIQCDLFFCARPAEMSHFQVISTAKSFGKPVIMDFDDNFIGLPTGHGDFNELLGKETSVRQSIALADQLWVTTQSIADAYKHPNTVIIPNAILPELLPDKPNGNTGTMLWRGASAHIEDLWTWRTEYERLSRRIKRFIWIGYLPTWASNVTGMNVEYAKWVETQQWFEFLKAQNIAAIWKPLLPAPVNDGKSNISLLEATLAGGLCVSNYAGKPGFEHAWRELPKKESDFVDGWQRAADHVREKYDLRAWNEVRYREILKLVNL